MATERRVNGSRLGRLSLLGKLAGGIAGGMIGEGAKQLAQGRRPVLGDMLLTEANANRLADRLSEMRGAAMKVGQLLSMDGGHLLPPELSRVLERLREDAHRMPLGQVASVLKQAWGAGWESHFERFFFQPVAAASIGQVHEARLKGGDRIAIKLQYPGIRRSIDSDVDNVATLLRLVRVIPEEFDIAPILEEAKKQLHLEADYRHEADALQRFASSIGDDARYRVPEVVEALSSEEVLVMQFLDGQPIESLSDAPSALRNSVAESLFELALREVFEWGLVQTDPNFANYLYDARAGQIQLLDFGATRTYTEDRRLALVELLQACVDGDDGDIAAAAVNVGYLGEEDEPTDYRDSIVELLRIATEPARATAPYRFADATLAQRMSDKVLELRVEERYARLPPTEILFLHRKLGGLYLLLAKLQARLPVADMLSTHLNPPEPSRQALAG